MATTLSIGAGSRLGLSSPGHQHNNSEHAITPRINFEIVQLDNHNAQFDLDKRSIRIYVDNDFPVLRIKAYLEFLAARQQRSSSEDKQRLKNAINELVFSCIQKAVNSNTKKPYVYTVDAPPREWQELTVPGGRYCYDNPDTIYRTIPIDGDSKYIIFGIRNPNSAPATDITFSLIKDPNSQGTVAILQGEDLVVNSDGTYQITIDSQPANGRVNHIQSNHKAEQLFVRHTLGDWLKESPDALSVVRIRENGESEPAELSDDEIACRTRKLLNSAIFYYGIGALGIKTMFFQHANTMKQPERSDSLGTLVTQANTFGHFKIEDNQALIVNVKLGGAKYFVLPLTNPWLITEDPVHHQTSLNNIQAKPNDDGSYTFVISKSDPLVWNWIDTGGLKEGTLFPRWQGLPEKAEEQPSIELQLVPLDELEQHLPKNTYHVTAEERHKQINDRIMGYQRRLI